MNNSPNLNLITCLEKFVFSVYHSPTSCLHHSKTADYTTPRYWNDLTQRSTKMKTLAYLITINCLQFVQGENCNSELADKIISFENNYWPGYQLGLYHKKVRSGTKLLLNLVSVGYTQSPGTLWISEKCRDQLCFSRYKYDQREREIITRKLRMKRIIFTLEDLVGWQ